MRKPLSRPGRQTVDCARDEGVCVVVVRPCYVFGMAVEPQARIDCYTERLQVGCNPQPAAGDLDRSDSGSRSELRCCAKNDGLRLVRVELQIIPQEPRLDSSRAVGEPLEGWCGVDFHCDQQLCVFGELVIRDADRFDEVSDWRHVSCEEKWP